ncbi:MAG TPA: hypothetical protein VE972_05310 [Conexibacter sp.]|nr:hypothetical protein [Conexibacter sp.]
MNGQMEPPLDLKTPRGIGELLTTAIVLFLRHSGLFLSVTLLVVAPVVVLVDGAWGGALHDGPNAHPSSAASLVSAMFVAFVVPALVTGLHAVIVREMGEGHVPGVGEALRRVGPRIPAAMGAVVLYSIGVGIGFILLVVPGIWLLVRWYFAAQSAVLNGTGPQQSLEASAELVKGRWWTTLLALIAAGVTFGVVGALCRLAAGTVDDGVLYVTLLTVIQAVTLSLSALFGTLLFFTMRAERGALDLLARSG